MAREASAAGAPSAGEIAARLDRLPMTKSMWTLVVLLSLGGFFEFYDLLFTGYIAPGLVRSGILTPATEGVFGLTGIASFVAAFFLGLYTGTAIFGFAADRFGRRAIFTTALLWYTAASIGMAFQSDAFGLNLWRFLAGIGIGVELITIDTYVSELVPRSARGRVFAINHAIQFCAVPVVAFLSLALVPYEPFGFDGWRWVVLIGAAGAVLVWWIRLRVPESPRWLAAHGHGEEASRILDALEANVAHEWGRALPPPGPPEQQAPRGNIGEIFQPPYLTRTIMMSVFNVFQAIGFYGFANWVPTLLIAQGIAITQSLQYTSIIAIAAPFGPLLGFFLADRVERKWAIVAAAVCVGIFGVAFGQMDNAAALIFFGVLVTLASNTMSFLYHAYQPELFPTRIRVQAVGFVYSWSRLSNVFSAFVIAFILAESGAQGVFAFIAGCMAIAAGSVALLGPRTSHRALEAISH